MSLTEKEILSLNGPIFIFGASGFIGANLFTEIFKCRKDCFAITHDPKSAWRLKLMDVPNDNILFCDITFKKSVNVLFSKLNPKTVFNLSAYGAYSRQNDTSLIYETNFSGTLNILEHCNEVTAYIHAGSSSEYGLNSASPLESDELQPNSHYAVSKVSTSYLIKFYGTIKKIPCLNLRLYSVYGPWEEPDRLVPRLIEFGQLNSYPPLVDPSIGRDFIYIDDCVYAFVKAAIEMKPGIYGESLNICSGEETKIGELVKEVTELLQINSSMIWGSMNNRSWDTTNWFGNYSKAQHLISWKPSITLREGLLKTIHWQIEIDYSSRILPYFNSPKKLFKISPVIACYKDAQAIPIMYSRLVAVFNEIGCNYEIIFVNDNSPDNTEEILYDICQNDINVIAIKHSRNFGSQSAFISGMEVASGDCVILMDGDLQDPPELIRNFSEKWIEGYQVVYGRRVKREASAFMNFAYKSFYKLFTRMSDINIPQDAGDFSLIDRKVVNHLIALPEKEQFVRGLRAWVGFRQIGVDYIRPERVFGKTTNSLRKNIGWAKKGIFSFSYLPLEIMSYLGIILTILSFLTILYQIIAKLYYPDTPQGISTLIVLILFFGGLNLLCISIIGEYLSKVVDETKARPKFIRDYLLIKGRKIESENEIQKLI
jgi:nucleoside-diphosphate-sugar epimerase/glycosyltransferase involved in cell wall biosynthesis